MLSPIARILRITCFAALLSTICAAGVAQEDPFAAQERYRLELFDRIAPSVVFISPGKGWLGTGFFVSGDGVILTNAHVVDKAKVVDVVTHDGTKLKGKVIERVSVDGDQKVSKAILDGLDLAVVKVDFKSKPVTLASLKDLRVGSWVGAIGHNEGSLWSFTTGMISNVYPQDPERPWFQTQIPINQGNSGGPIFDRQGRVVGIVTAKGTGNNINWAIPVEVATRRLKSLGKSCECVTVSVPGKLPVYVNGKMVGTGPSLLIPAKQAEEMEFMVIIDGKMQKRKIRYPDTREVEFK